MMDDRWIWTISTLSGGKRTRAQNGLGILRSSIMVHGCNVTGDAIGYIKQDEIKNGQSQEIWYHTVPKLSL